MRDEPFRFLIADDHAVVRRGVREMLHEEFRDAVFGEATTAQEALDLAWKNAWDLIILDITMPGRSGLDILRDLKAATPGAAVLVQSMHAEDQFAMRVLKAGASGYITKDSMPEELLRAVGMVLDGRRYVSSLLGEQLAVFISAEAGRPAHERLSDREFQVLRMIAGGRSITEIGAELSLSVKTISTYRARIIDKLGVRTNLELARYAAREGLVE
jgi:two-component system invasion response regulator UvrY